MTNRFASITRYFASRKRRFGVAAAALVTFEMVAAAAVAMFAHDRLGARETPSIGHGASIQLSTNHHDFSASLRVF